MNKRIFFGLSAGIVFGLISIVSIKNLVNEQAKKDFRKTLEQARAKKKERKALFREARTRYDFEMLKDPATGKIPAGIFEKEITYAKKFTLKRIGL